MRDCKVFEIEVSFRNVLKELGNVAYFRFSIKFPLSLDCNVGIEGKETISLSFLVVAFGKIFFEIHLH